MTVSELIIALQALDPTLPVMINGYEYGLLDLVADGICLQQVALNANADPVYGGPHEELEEGYPQGAAAVPAVVFSRHGAIG